ncbi:aggregation-promoting factor C-terminal-like domain-containing protein, partial [Streptomyces sp. NPDC001761]
ALPGSKMSSVGADWQTNPATQIKWGLNYMNSVYGSPCQAWTFWQANHWY